MGIHIRADGFCRLEDVLSAGPLRSMGATQEEVMAATESNEKKRFDVAQEGGEWFIRAAQGHSMKVVDDESLLKRLSPHDSSLPAICVHGTYRRHLPSILEKGLVAGGGVSGRNHVHFAPREPGDGRVISGMRSNCEVAIYLDLPAAIRGGVPFFISANEVILSPGIKGVVPKEYIQKVQDLQTGEKLPTG